MEQLMKDIKQVLVTKEEIRQRNQELGAEITRDFAGKEVVLVGILKGAMPFLCDLMRSIDLPVALDTMCASSYGSGTETSGCLTIRKDLDGDIRGKHVIVVEDIIDTGFTLSMLVPNLIKRGAASVDVAVFLDKIERRKVDVNVRYTGFVVPDEFIVGYGCDYAERYRNIPEVCTLKSEIYKQPVTPLSR